MNLLARLEEVDVSEVTEEGNATAPRTRRLRTWAGGWGRSAQEQLLSPRRPASKDLPDRVVPTTVPTAVTVLSRYLVGAATEAELPSLSFSR